ncbi:MAG TPA: glycoside hydrolase family 76 protein [Streptosporangiaceae bacterium]|nr:glycoside hydrolase family 76 protein [Streptosporangiaceae bacterium]
MGHSWWQAAVALSTLETYQQTTGDTTYAFAVLHAFLDHSGGNFENSFNDDTGWWGLAWVQAYQIFHQHAYLAMAETIANYVHRSWDGTCGGGVWWKTNAKYPGGYKNAITNELFLELTAWLHNSIRGDTKYLRWAKAEWSWFDHSGMINSSSLVNDGLRLTKNRSVCVSNHATTWTYNQGVILAGLSQLYKATRNAGWLRVAERIGRAAIQRLTISGVLHEPCTGSGCGNNTGGDAQSFKGIFVRGLKVLAVTARTTQFSAFFKKQARSIETRDTNRFHQLGFRWGGPIVFLTSYSQASALDAIVASLKLPT